MLVLFAKWLARIPPPAQGQLSLEDQDLELIFEAAEEAAGKRDDVEEDLILEYDCIAKSVTCKRPASGCARPDSRGSEFQCSKRNSLPCRCRNRFQNCKKKVWRVEELGYLVGLFLRFLTIARVTVS